MLIIYLLMSMMKLRKIENNIYNSAKLLIYANYDN
jgi:hypothetical protein